MEGNIDLQMENVGPGHLFGRLKPELQSIGSELLLYIGV